MVDHGIHVNGRKKCSTKHGLPRRRKPTLPHAEITLTKIADIGDAFCSYEHAAEGLGIKVVQPTLDYFVIYGGGNDQCDIEITSLAELLPCNLGVDQSRDCDERCPDRAEAAGRHSSVMNGHDGASAGAPDFFRFTSAMLEASLQG